MAGRLCCLLPGNFASGTDYLEEYPAEVGQIKYLQTCRYRCHAPVAAMSRQPARIMHPGGYKQRLQSNFQRRSEKYDDNDTVHPPLCAELLKRAQLQPGQTVLDAACGTGLICLAAADLVGPSGVWCVSLSTRLSSAVLLSNNAGLKSVKAGN